MNKRKITIGIVIIIIALNIGANIMGEKSNGACCEGSTVSYKSINAYKARIIPQIDGIKSPNEWEDTQFYTFKWNIDEQNIVEGDFYIKIGFKYNSTYLFILAEITEDENPKTLWGLLALFFDSDNDVFKGSPDHVGLVWNVSYEEGTVHVLPSGIILDSNSTPRYDPSQPVRCTYKKDIYTIEAAVYLSRINMTSSKLDIAYDDGRECVSVVNLTQPSNYISFIFSDTYQKPQEQPTSTSFGEIIRFIATMIIVVIVITVIIMTIIMYLRYKRKREKHTKYRNT